MNSLGHTVTFSDYNGRDHPGKRTGVNGEVTDYVYDTRGRLTTATTRRNNIAASRVWTYAANGLLASMTSPDGVVETYTYDAARRLTEVERVESDATFKRLISYDAASNVTRLLGYLLDTADRLIFDETRQYDEQNRLTGVSGAPQNLGNDAHARPFGYDLNVKLREHAEILAMGASHYAGPVAAILAGIALTGAGRPPLTLAVGVGCAITGGYIAYDLHD
jgi:YD repeat-containing protein